MPLLWLKCLECLRQDGCPTTSIGSAGMRELKVGQPCGSSPKAPAKLTCGIHVNQGHGIKSLNVTRSTAPTTVTMGELTKKRRENEKMVQMVKKDMEILLPVKILCAKICNRSPFAVLRSIIAAIFLRLKTRRKGFHIAIHAHHFKCCVPERIAALHVSCMHQAKLHFIALADVQSTK